MLKAKKSGNKMDIDAGSQDNAGITLESDGL
jgi:hypothetical protein